MNKKGRPFGSYPPDYETIFQVGDIVFATRTRRKLYLEERYQVLDVHPDRTDFHLQLYALQHLRTGDRVYSVPMRRGSRRPLLRLYARATEAEPRTLQNAP